MHNYKEIDRLIIEVYCPHLPPCKDVCEEAQRELDESIAFEQAGE